MQILSQNAPRRIPKQLQTYPVANSWLMGFQPSTYAPGTYVRTHLAHLARRAHLRRLLPQEIFHSTMPPPVNDTGFYYSELALAAARYIDERPWLHVGTFADQRSIFVGVCMSIERWHHRDETFITFRSRVLHAYTKLGLPQRFPSLSDTRRKTKRTAKQDKRDTDASQRAQSHPFVSRGSQAYMDQEYVVLGAVLASAMRIA